MLKSLGLAFRWCSHCVAQIAQLAQAHVFRVGSMTASALKKLNIKIGGSSSGDFELVNSSPREKVVEISLNADEQAMFDHSVDAVKGLVEACKGLEPSLG